MRYQLILKNLSLNVKLGYLEKERFLPQQVSIQISLQFTEIPLACITDNLTDTLCYATLSCKLQKFCDGHSFKLIESLAYKLYAFLKQTIANEKIKIFLCLTKNPPLANLEQSSFSISD